MTASRPRRISWLGLALGILSAAALIGGVHTLSPLEPQRVATFVDTKIDRFNSVLKQITAMRDQVTSTPFGENYQDDQTLAQRVVDFGPRQRYLSYQDEVPVGSANVLLLRHSELSRISVGLDPNEVALTLKYNDHSVFEKHQLSNRSYIDDIASVAYERPYQGWVTEQEAIGMAKRLEQLETVIIYRIGKVLKTQQQADEVIPGYMPAEAFVFDVSGGDLISSFSFASTNSSSIDQNDFLQTNSDWILRKDLSDNLEIVFWSQLKERMPKAVFQHELKDAPFTLEALTQARILAVQR